MKEEITMKIFKEGDTNRAICPQCGIVEGKYLLRDIKVQRADEILTVKNLLVLVCNFCDATIASPAQSTPLIRSVLTQKHSLETRIPAHFKDILNLAIQKINPELDEAFYKTLLLFYIKILDKDLKAQNNAFLLLSGDMAIAPLSSRISLKINKAQHEIIDGIIARGIFPNKTQLVKAVILSVYNDILLNKNKENIEKLKQISLIC